MSIPKGNSIGNVTYMAQSILYLEMLRLFSKIVTFMHVNPPNKTNTLTAQGRTDPNQNTGISIHDCIVKAASDLKASQSSVTT